jgi:hypothetical protein
MCSKGPRPWPLGHCVGHQLAIDEALDDAGLPLVGSDFSTIAQGEFG